MNAGPSRKIYIQPEPPPCQKFQKVASPSTALTAFQPPAPCTASGSAIANPPSFTASCTIFPHAEVRSPPAAKYTMTTAPPIRQPAYFGTPATTLRIDAMAISWPAGIASEPIQISSDVIA